MRAIIINKDKAKIVIHSSDAKDYFGGRMKHAEYLKHWKVEQDFKEGKKIADIIQNWK